MRPRIVAAAYSNGRTRDWPRHHVRQLAALCVESLDAVVEFVGSPAQRPGVNAIVRGLPADRCVNRCGRLTWQQTGALIESAACVVSGNSGIGHFAASLGVPVVCIFGATHSPFEWMPRGPHVSVLARRTQCALCGVVRSAADCPHALRCLGDIAPADVLREIRRLVARDRRSASASFGAESGTPPPTQRADSR